MAKNKIRKLLEEAAVPTIQAWDDNTIQSLTYGSNTYYPLPPNVENGQILSYETDRWAGVSTDLTEELNNQEQLIDTLARNLGQLQYDNNKIYTWIKKTSADGTIVDVVFDYNKDTYPDKEMYQGSYYELVGKGMISFTIDGTAYQAEEGMTWSEWVNSEYNTDGYTAEQGGEVETRIQIYNKNGRYIYSGSGTAFEDTVIIANETYATKGGAPT